MRSRSLVLLACAVALALAGCTARPAQVVSAWPVATTEATVAASAEGLRFPLTGLTLPPGASYPVSPICAKVADSGSNAAISGLGSADVVYETADSGSGTQLAALYQSTAPGRVGPLGPAGMPDLWIVPQYHAVLFSTGGTATVAASIKRGGLLDMSQGSAAGDFAYATVASPRRLSGTYLNGRRAYQQVEAIGSSVASDSARLRFSESTGATASPTAAVSIPFSATRVVSWSWDPVSGTYRRSQDGHAQRDAPTRKRVSAKNVVVMWARYTALDADIAGSGGYDVTLGGSGQATVFRDGQRFEGRWKADGSSPPTFAAESGQAIRLAPGNTWLEVIPLSANITLR